MERQDFLDNFSCYRTLSEMLKACSYEEILSAATELLGLAPEVLEQYPMGGYSKGRTSGAYRFTLQDLQRNISFYDWLYVRLEDEVSRHVFSNLVGYRILPLPSFLQAAYDGEHPQYFDKGIVSCGEDEVFVDCGGFTGGTAEEFIRQFQGYKRIYVYEPSPDNAKICSENLSKYEDITIRPCRAGERKEMMYFSGGGSAGSFTSGQQGGEQMEITSLDEDIREKVTFIKMDIEASEIPALLGAKRHIREDFPKLAVCVYHIVSDLWEIPSLIDAIRSGYRFYLRHYRADQNCETTLYAVPPEGQGTGRGTRPCKRIAALSALRGNWTNAQLTKDCGLVPWLLHKNHGHDVCMVGEDCGPYPYLEAYVKGLEMEFLSGENYVSEMVHYMEENAGDIDALILYGPYDPYYAPVKTYKSLNPRGKIYLALDANSQWMDRILWDDKDFMGLMDACDVIGASCRSIQRHLNEKWPWKIEYLPNGWYDFSGRHSAPVFEEKEDVILTVGRLGTEQKATEILLEAFARIADRIPGWTLRLVGNVEDGFAEYTASYFGRFPDLKERVLFTGPIADREKLFGEYRRAKLFALPSRWEGAPNVIGEALLGGCVTAVTKYDAYEDATDAGRCGLAAAIDDTDGFAGILLELCTGRDLKWMSEHAYLYARTNFNMEKIVARLNEMLFGMEESYA